jgi:predicted TPR repeat methyltransferase
VAHSQLGDPTAAMAAWERALEIEPSHVDALFNLGVTAAESAQMERARSAFGHFLEVAPPLGYEREIEVARRALLEMPG